MLIIKERMIASKYDFAGSNREYFLDLVEGKQLVIHLSNRRLDGSRRDEFNLIANFDYCMNFLKGLLSPRSRTRYEGQMDSILRENNIRSRSPMPDRYPQTLAKHFQTCLQPQKLVKLLIQQVGELSQAESLTKLLVLLHTAVIDQQYPHTLMTALQDLQILTSRTLIIKQHAQWFPPFFRAYCGYLSRLSAIGDVVDRWKTIKNSPSKTALTDMFRLLNQLGLLFPALNNAINTIGRYYRTRHSIFSPLYAVLRRELLVAYECLGKIVTFFLNNPEQFGNGELHCFLQTLPEVELMVDRVEEFLVNKYFEGRVPPMPVALKEEEVLRLQYYLKMKES